MEGKMQPFLFEGDALVRVIDREDAPWFVAADVCKTLGLSNPTEAVRGLDEDEKGISTAETLGGLQEVIVVSESGLYALIFKSRKPQAVRFRKWVTGEVLPAIRRTGMYAPQVVERIVPHDAAIRPKPFEEWTLEEIRTHLSVANGYRHTLNNAAAAWYLMREGFPRPPERLMPAWWQSDLDLRKAGESRALVVVSMPNGGGAH